VQVSQAISSFIGNQDKSSATLRGQAIDRQMFQLKRGVQIVVGTPGRVIDLFDRGSLKLEYVKWLVLDEADEMLSMGFIDDVEKFSKLHQLIARRLSSATMPPSIRQLVTRFLRSPVTVTVEQPKSGSCKDQSSGLLGAAP